MQRVDVRGCLCTCVVVVDGRVAQNKLRAQNAETMAELEEARVQLQRRRSQASRVGPSSMEVENPLLKAV